jgi:hypothetical protein
LYGIEVLEIWKIDKPRFPFKKETRADLGRCSLKTHECFERSKKTITRIKSVMAYFSHDEESVYYSFI